MGRLALGAHISSKWWECPSARSVAVAVDRSWMPCIRRGTAVFDQHKEGNGSMFGVPRSPVKSPFRCGVRSTRNCSHVLCRSLFEVCM